MATKKKSPGWSDVKVKLAEADRNALLSLVQDLYGASKDNQAFLHARFIPSENVLDPYKQTLDRWLAPDPSKNQDTSVSKAKKAISDYKKAAANPEGIAELMVYYCECAAAFSQEYGLDDEGYFAALVLMYEQALKATLTLHPALRERFLTRLSDVRVISHDFGYGAGDEMDTMVASLRLDG